ncbi:MAG: hypothetical protein KBT06_03155 [Prevotellaceae bacterium]|nr:hypothetical protein [Candidatus Colivivens equi]
MYSSLSQLPKGLYNILTYLALNNENIWKMMKYNSYDALSHPNLSMGEKLAFLWKHGAQEEYSLFFTNLVEDEICESKCILKMYQYYIHANPSQYLSTIVYAFDFLYGGTMSLVDYDGVPANRGDLFVHEIMATLNGADIDGVGKLQFNDKLSRYSAARSVIGNSKTFTGESVYMTVLMGDAGVEVGCGD